MVLSTLARRLRARGVYAFADVRSGIVTTHVGRDHCIWTLRISQPHRMRADDLRVLEDKIVRQVKALREAE